MVFKHSKLRRVILLAFGLTTWGASAAEFNTDVLDAEDLQNIDISRFSVAGYVPPGDYVLTVWVNGLRLGAHVIFPYMRKALLPSNALHLFVYQQICCN